MSAPSFSSFPPAFSSFPDFEAGPSAPKDKNKIGEERRREKGDKKDKRKARERDDDRQRASNDEKKRIHEHERKSRRHRSGDEDKPTKHRKKEESLYVEGTIRTDTDARSRIFFEDHKGDDLNVTYGSLHLGDVPKYRPVARGYSILGLDDDWVVVYRGSKGIEIGSKGDGQRKSPQLTDKKTRALLASGPIRRLQPSAKSLIKYDEVDGFIRIPSRKGKEKEQAYRSVENDKEDNSDSESSSGSEGHSSIYDSDTIIFSAREEAIRDLELKLQANPTSIQDWLLLLSHSLSDTSASSKSATVARADITVSVLRRALSAHEDNSRSPLLRLKYLRAGEDLWQHEENKMSQEWEAALSSTNNVDLWVEWLDWSMRKGGKNYEDTLLNALRALGGLPRDLTKEDADRARLRIFWRVTECMKQAGYVERCTALFQAQAELTFFVPDDIRDSPLEQQQNALEEFWESEVPRIGETSAKGWKHSLKHPDASPPFSAGSISKPSGHDPVELWRQYESQSDKHLILSRRASDMDEDDPFTTVLFSDIRPYLISLQTKEGLETFRSIWLTSLGLYIPGLTASISSMGLDDRWASSALARSKIIQRLFPSPESHHLITADSFAGATIGREKKYAWSFEVLKEWSMGSLGPFVGITANGRGRMWEDQDSFEVNQDLINCIFQQLRMPTDGLDWDIQALEFSASCNNLSEVLKASQALLSSYSSSPELLAAHARLERIKKKTEKARKVYRVTLSSLSQREGHSIAQVYWDAAEFEWLQSQNEAALDIVSRAAGQEGSKTGVQLLRVKRRLEELSQEKSDIPDRYRLYWIKLSILLELLTGTLEAAIGIADRYEKREKSGKPQHEAITIAKLLLVYHHTVTLRNPAPTSVLRSLVRNALEMYPSNTIVLGLFLECEKGEGVWGRVRNLMTENAVGTLQEKSVVRRIFDVWIANWEEGRWLGEVERIRSSLEAAINSDRTKGSPILWKIFVMFETATGDLKKAKATLFRALHECPLVKNLYLLAFEEDLRPAFSNRELLYLTDAMAERGIRLRRSLGELFEEADGLDPDGEQKRGGDVSDEGDDSELEYNSRELRRLMPY